MQKTVCFTLTIGPRSLQLEAPFIRSPGSSGLPIGPPPPSKHYKHPKFLLRKPIDLCCFGLWAVPAPTFHPNLRRYPASAIAASPAPVQQDHVPVPVQRNIFQATAPPPSQNYTHPKVLLRKPIDLCCFGLWGVQPPTFKISS